VSEILLVSDRSFSTGIGSYSYQLVKHLKEVGQVDFDIINLSTIAEDSYGGILDSSFHKFKRLIVHFLFLSSIPRNYRVYHVLNPNLGILITKCRPVVVTVHDLYPLTQMATRDFVGSSYGLDLPILMAMRFNMSFVKHADRVISVSEHTKKDLVSLLGVDASRINVIYPGIDRSSFYVRDKRTARRNLYLPEDRTLVLHVGVDEPRKNIRTLIQAFHQVRKNIPDALLVRIGGIRSTTRKLISSLQLESSVVHYKGVPNIALFYNAADLFVFPSYYEGFGLPVLEAMASGLPVIAGKSSSIPEVVGNAGILFEPSDIEMLSHLICQVLADKQIEQRMAMEGLRRSSKFDWSICARQTIGVYESLYS
jgi:glycosyltransferase involved in cell wall biosynthesis